MLLWCFTCAIVCLCRHCMHVSSLACCASSAARPRVKHKLCCGSALLVMRMPFLLCARQTAASCVTTSCPVQPPLGWWSSHQQCESMHISMVRQQCWGTGRTEQCCRARGTAQLPRVCLLSEHHSMQHAGCSRLTGPLTAACGALRANCWFVHV